MIELIDFCVAHGKGIEITVAVWVCTLALAAFAGHMDGWHAGYRAGHRKGEDSGFADGLARSAEAFNLGEIKGFSKGFCTGRKTLAPPSSPQ